MDSFMNAFKANVTAPFPAFHSRNFVSGQLRNAMAGMFSFRSLKDSLRLFHGHDLEGLENVAAIKQRFDMLKTAGAQLPDVLDNSTANQVLRYMIREQGVVGKYGKDVPIDVMNMSREHVASPESAGRSSGSMAEMQAGAAGKNPFSYRYAAEEYLGLGHKGKQKVPAYYTKRSGKKGVRYKYEDVRIPTSTIKGPYLPFPTWDMHKYPQKAIGKAAQWAGDTRPWANRWGQAEVVRTPSVFRTPGVYENMGLGASDELIGGFVKKDGKETGKRILPWGPVAGGLHMGHAVEFQNRVAPMLKLLYEGVDPSEAARMVSSAQISYRAKDYTPTEQQILKRIFPFYSFTSRSLPWTIEQYLERPGNALSQIIKGVKRTTEHKAAQIHHPGPTPPYLGDSMAIPWEAEEPGAKRYLTGMELMEQDIWQLGAPLLSGDFKGLGYELASRAAPLWGKLPIEGITGTSLFQRGVEGGRPLRNMDPLMGRAYANTMQQIASLMGEKIDPERVREMVGETGAFEHVMANTPYSRYIQSWRTAMDPRKNLKSTAINLLSGAKFQDVSLPAQETILREHLRSLISQSGGTVFEKATFPNALLEYWKKTDPEKFVQAMQLKALSDERTKVAKKMRDLTKQGLPAGMALQP
jgi:hypothetical protein